MNITEYLTTPNSGFGSLAWVFLVVQMAAIIGGLYLAMGHSDAYPSREQRLRQIGTILAILGVLGALFALLRLTQLFTPRYLMYLVALLEVGVLGYALYYWYVLFPKEERQPGIAKSRRATTEPAFQINNARRSARAGDRATPLARREAVNPTQQQLARASRQAAPQPVTEQPRSARPAAPSGPAVPTMGAPKLPATESTSAITPVEAQDTRHTSGRRESRRDRKRRKG